MLSSSATCIPPCLPSPRTPSRAREGWRARSSPSSSMRGLRWHARSHSGGRHKGADRDLRSSGGIPAAASGTLIVGTHACEPTRINQSSCSVDPPSMIDAEPFCSGAPAASAPRAGFAPISVPWGAGFAPFSVLGLNRATTIRARRDEPHYEAGGRASPVPPTYRTGAQWQNILGGRRKMYLSGVSRK